jgi:hypothetical protein
MATIYNTPQSKKIATGYGNAKHFPDIQKKAAGSQGAVGKYRTLDGKPTHTFFGVLVGGRRMQIPSQ